jgi:hypothetical protein
LPHYFFSNPVFAPIFDLSIFSNLIASPAPPNQATSSIHSLHPDFFDCSIGAEDTFARVPLGLCRGCRGLVNPLHAAQVPPPLNNPLGLVRHSAARCSNYFYTDVSRCKTEQQQPRRPTPYTPLEQLRQQRLRDQEARNPLPPFNTLRAASVVPVTFDVGGAASATLDSATAAAAAAAPLAFHVAPLTPLPPPPLPPPSSQRPDVAVASNADFVIDNEDDDDWG